MSVSIVGEQSRIVLLFNSVFNKNLSPYIFPDQHWKKKRVEVHLSYAIIRCCEITYWIRTLKICRKSLMIFTLLTKYVHTLYAAWIVQFVNCDLVCVPQETILKIKIFPKSKAPSSSSPHATFLPKLNVQVAFKSLSLHQCSCQKLEAIIAKALSAVYETACARSDQFLHYTLDAPTCLSSTETRQRIHSTKRWV